MEAIIAGAFALLIGIVGMWTGFRQLRNRAALNLWKTTKGKVIERGSNQPNNINPTALRHIPLVKYVYQVEAQEFVSDRIHPKRLQLPQYGNKKWAQARAQSFPDEVTVHYNPEDPGESFLVQTPKRMLYVIIGGSCVAILFGVMLFLIK